MEQSNRFLQSALDAVSRQVTIIDSSGTIRACNASFREFARANGWDCARQLEGASYDELWPASSGTREYSNKVRAGLEAVRSGAQSAFWLEYSIKVASATRHFTWSAIRFSASEEHAALLEDTGPLLLVEHEDITTRKLLERQFHHAQKMDALGQLASGVAHDFNNLLTVIRSYGDLLMQEFAPEGQQRGDMDQILKATEAASALTKQLLTFGRQQMVKLEVLDVNAIIVELDKMLRRLLGDEIEYASALEQSVSRVEADSGQVQQILMNLVMNARDAMPRGGKVTIETKDVELDDVYSLPHGGVRPGRYVAIELTDTGCGMSQEVQSRIFEPFFTTKEVGKGTGLGLSTVYGIVQQCRGHIWVYSEIDRGTTFKVYLPCVDQAPSAVRLPSVPAPAETSETILVVEDNIAVRSVLCRVLRDAGYNVLESCDAAQASGICESYEQRIQLLLTDVVMPGVNGPELAVELLRRRPDMKVLFMSGYSGTAITRHGVLREGLAFLPKPFSPATVRRAVRAALTG